MKCGIRIVLNVPAIWSHTTVLEVNIHPKTGLYPILREDADSSSADEGKDFRRGAWPADCQKPEGPQTCLTQTGLDAAGPHVACDLRT